MAFVQRESAPREDCPTPIRRAVMKQGWYDLAYIHFRYDPEAVAKICQMGSMLTCTTDRHGWV